MIAGLLGEHLASPRTATKTNQNTALEPNSKRDSDPTGEDGFASYVAKESDPSAAQTPTAEDALAAPSVPPVIADAASPATTGGQIAPPAATTSDDTLEPKLDAASPANTATNASSSIDDQVRADVDAKNVTSEVLDEDARLRPAADPRDSERAPRQGTIKLAQDGVPASPHTALVRSERNSRAAVDVTALTAANADSAEPGQALVPDDGVDARLTSGGEPEFRAPQTEASELSRLTTPVVSRDTPAIGAEPTLTIGAAAPGSTPAQVSSGLAPTAPAIPIAAPSDLTSVILNAVKNGADPQEQLVVQLDPPELGRVMIDFKFDAQGLQQITITSENPEALKRLRELHFELTQALRENGLSEQNMSFRQEAEERPQSAWQDQNQQRQNAQLIAAEDRRASPSAMPAQPNVSARDRLDLLL